jgi:hypothetical protein
MMAKLRMESSFSMLPAAGGWILRRNGLSCAHYTRRLRVVKLGPNAWAAPKGLESAVQTA